jgi:hypothetical protein
MMKQLPVLITLCLGQALFPALAADPPASTPSAQPPAASSQAEEGPKSAPSTTAAAAPAETSSSSEDAKQAADAAQAKRLRGMGWKPQVRNGETVFCKQTAQIGSRFTTEECASGEDIDRRTRDSQNAIKKFQMQNTIAPHAT